MDGVVRALVIEDDPVSRELFFEVLADAEIPSVCVDHEALPESSSFTVVVSDLPTLNGRYSSAKARDWVALLRQRYRVPVVLITGRSEATHDDDLAREVSSIVAKPPDIDDLIGRIRRAGLNGG